VFEVAQKEKNLQKGIKKIVYEVDFRHTELVSVSHPD
jgi:hypothetical protein